MKKLIISFLILHCTFFISQRGMTQDCLPEGITFIYQVEIDSFQVMYPGCNRIDGDIIICGKTDCGAWSFGSNITNFNGLSCLNSIGGDLYIWGMSIHDLKGLEGLTTIGGDLRILDNHSLVNLAGLDNLISIGGEIVIQGNANLISLEGLDHLPAATITKITICNNSSLSACNLQGLCDYLISPDGQVDIYLNAPGCNSPAEIASGCGVTLACLPFGNYYFFSQEEVDSFQTNYPDCSDVQGSVSITGSDIEELSGLSQVTSISGSLNIGSEYGQNAVGNPMLTSLKGLENLTEIGGTLMIMRVNESLSNLNGLDNLTTIGSDLLIGINFSHTPTPRNMALTSLRALSNLTSIGGQLYISCTSLTNLEGLENLSSIGGSFGIWSNGILGNFAGLENLSSIGGEMRIHNNPNLTCLTGLDNIEANSISDLHITHNYSLSTCDVQSICEYLAGPHGIVEIYNNASGCNSQEQVKAVCAEGVDELAIGGQQPAVSVVPNPVFSRSEIKYQISKSKSVVVKVLNIRGSEISTLVNEDQAPGEYTVPFDASGLPAGIYLVRLEAGEDVTTSKLVVMR